MYDPRSLLPLIDRLCTHIAEWQDSHDENTINETIETHPFAGCNLDLLERTLTGYLDRLTTGNYPFFHPSYAGQMLKPPHPAALLGYWAAQFINPNNHALDGGPPVSLVREGAWSLFRLMQDGQLRGLGPPDVFELGLGSGRHRVRFRLKAASVENPFDLGLLAGFACPEAL